MTTESCSLRPVNPPHLLRPFHLGVAAAPSLDPLGCREGHSIVAMAQTTVNLASKGLGCQALARGAKASKRAQVCPPRNAVKEVFMPALSSTMTEGKIVSWLKSPGDKVKKGESIVVVESGAVGGPAFPRPARCTATNGVGAWSGRPSGRAG